MRLRWIALLFVAAAFPAIKSSKADGQKWWTRSIISEPAPHQAGRRLELQGVTNDGDRLIGELSLLQSRNGTSLDALTIEGHLDRTGQFTPNVSLEVSNDQRGTWKVIESSLSDKAEAKLIVAPQVSAVSVIVSLTAFRPYTPTYRYGRITLQTGEATVFGLRSFAEDK